MKHEVAFPFTWVSGDEGNRWKPGVTCGAYGPQVYHGTGKMVITELARCSAAGFQDRVLYTRTWIDPDGKHFGKARKVRVLAIRAFSRLIGGHRYRECKLVAREFTSPGTEVSNEHL